MRAFIATTQPAPAPRKLTRDEAKTVVSILVLMLVLCTVLLAAAILLLRMRTYRRRAARAIGLAEEAETEGDAGRHRVDPWSESARRLAVVKDDDDTVDIDPMELGPDDVDPLGPPHNGKGAH